MTQQKKDAVIEEEKTDQAGTTEEILDELSEDPRLKLYEEIDKARGVYQEKPVDQNEDQDVEDAEQAEKPSDVDEAGTAKEDDTPLILSRDEFEEHFKNVIIRTKVAGEDVEAPVKDFVKATGLEKHWTKRLQELSKREKEVLEAAKSRTSFPGWEGPSEEEIQEKYDEFFAESPYKAKAFLEELEAQKQEATRKQTKARVDKAVSDFRAIYPECTDEEWDKMNDPGFWQSHEDVVKFRDDGDVFATLVTAYTRFKQSQVVAAGADQAITARTSVSPGGKTERKKAGQVIRTTIKPEPASPRKKEPEITREQANADYINALKRQARERMRIPD